MAEILGPLDLRRYKSFEDGFDVASLVADLGYFIRSKVQVVRSLLPQIPLKY